MRTATFSTVMVGAFISLTAEGIAQTPQAYTRADTLRGSYATPGRAWWDVTFYDLNVSIEPADSTIHGYNTITYQVLEPANEMQIDLMTPLEVDSIVQDGQTVSFHRDGNAFFATLTAPQQPGDTNAITVHYHGRPRIAPRPPWDGGFTWTADSLGQPWVVTTDQGVGASIWWPNKDTQADEPDSQRVAITVPRGMIQVGNGRLRGTTENPDSTTTHEWFVANPINNYAIHVAAGSYANYSEAYEGENGTLTLDFWPLTHHLDAAKRQWAQVHPTLQCFEHWFGPYPWYEDGYKLVEVPYNGMEHQSAVTYGNGFANGYRGRDPSGTGLGLEWDFIIVHESAHEWFANNFTAKDQADMWVHESFANYAEGLYTECLFGKDAGAAYIIGNRRGIQNDRPIVPDAYGVNAKGSDDMYPKGGNILHTIRQVVNDDEKWRAILRGVNETFWHRTVTGAQIESYISEQAGVDLSKVFDQYLRTTQIPMLEYGIENDMLHYRWANVVPGFDMPIEVALAAGETTVIRPTEAWQTMPLNLASPVEFAVDEDYYVGQKEVATPR
ncbi:MAG: M1 family metallopeptidase [Longimicrobiales bacterium]